MKDYNKRTKDKKASGNPLKIYLSKEDTVVVMYTGILEGDDFEVLNTTCVISKNYFYNAMDKLKSTNETCIEDNDVKIKIKIIDKVCEIVIMSGKSRVEINNVESNFVNWLLSIDLRNTKRVNTLIPVSIAGISNFEYGALLDISQTGFKVATSTEFQNNGDVKISIFDEEMSIGDILCEIKHMKVVQDKFVYGLKMKGVSMEQEQKIDYIFKREYLRSKE